MERDVQYPEWPWIKMFYSYLRHDRRIHDLLILIGRPPYNGDERKFLEDSIRGLKKEDERLGSLFSENWEKIEQYYEDKENGNGDPVDLRNTLEGYPFWYLVEFFSGWPILRELNPKGGGEFSFMSIDVSYPTLIEELEYRLRNLPKSDEEIAQLIEEKTDTTAQERQTVKDKLSWMVELGIIDYLWETYKPTSTNSMGEFVAKILGEKQTTVVSYLNGHIIKRDPLDNENFKTAITERFGKVINRKQ